MKGKKTTIILTEENYRKLKLFPLPIGPFLNLMLEEFFNKVDLKEVQRIWLEKGEEETEKFIRQVLAGGGFNRTRTEQKGRRTLEDKFKGFF